MCAMTLHVPLVSFGKFASLTVTRISWPWHMATLTCSRGRCIPSTSFDFVKGNRGTANLPWSIPSMIMLMTPGIAPGLVY